MLGTVMLQWRLCVLICNRLFGFLFVLVCSFVGGLHYVVATPCACEGLWVCHWLLLLLSLLNFPLFFFLS